MVKPTMEDFIMKLVMFGRDALCKLVGLEVEGLNSLRRRGQMPSVPNLGLDEKAVNEGGYDAFSALLLILALTFTDRFEVSRNRACELAGSAAGVLDKRWTEICRSSLDLAEGRRPAAHILFAVIEGSIPKGRHKIKSIPFCGTAAEMSAAHPDATNIIAISVSECAAEMRQRAREHQIALEEFWAV
jgi:hypothetical protein